MGINFQIKKRGIRLQKSKGHLAPEIIKHFPIVEFYMSDYLQLGYYIQKPIEYYDESGKKRVRSIDGYNYKDEGGINIIMINLWYIGQLSKIYGLSEEEKFFNILVDWYNFVWFHEYLHLIGFTEPMIVKMKNHIIEID